MRKHFWKYLINSSGEPVAGARIHVFLTDSVTSTDFTTSSNINNDIFTDISSNAYVNLTTTKNAPINNFDKTNTVVGEIRTASNGFFEFYIADKEEVTNNTSGSPGYNGDKAYDYNTYFTLVWVRNGLDIGYVENVQIFSIKTEVDETDSTSIHSDRKNKLISNKQAYNWNQHILDTVDVHGLEPVNKISTNTLKNKLVSNYDIKLLEDHRNDYMGNAHSQYLRRDATVSMTSDSLINNLNADLLDGEEGSYYTNYTDDEIDNHDVSSGIHGVTGDVVGTSDFQVITNKTITDSEFEGDFSGEINTLTTSLSIANGGTGASDANTARVNIGAQEASINLSDIGSLSPSLNSFIVGDGSNYISKSLIELKTLLSLGTAASQDTTDFLLNSDAVFLNSTTGTLELSGGLGLYGTPAPSAQEVISTLTLSDATTGSDDTINLAGLNTQLSNIESKVNEILTVLSNYGLIS